MSFITLVSGLPRSGTSLMMSMLQAGGMPILSDGVRTADEDNPAGYFELEAIKNVGRDPSCLDGAEGRAVKVISYLLEALPLDRDYRVIFMKRSLRETLASQSTMLARRGEDDAGLPAGEMAVIFRRDLARSLSWLEAQPRFRVLEVDYRALVLGPDRQVAAIDAFLGGGLDTGAMCAAVDPSLYRQRQEATSPFRKRTRAPRSSS